MSFGDGELLLVGALLREEVHVLPLVEELLLVELTEVRQVRDGHVAPVAAVAGGRRRRLARQREEPLVDRLCSHMDKD